MKKLCIILTILLSSCHGHVMTQQETRDYETRQQKCEDAVSAWIKKHAIYPESYQSLGFKDYVESDTYGDEGKVENSENYSIFHTHRIKNKNGDTVTFSGYFKLEYDYFVDIIDTAKTNSIGGAFPPENDIWISQFGKPYSAADSADFNKRAHKAIHNLAGELKNSTFANDKQGKQVLEMLDSIGGN